MLRLVVWLLFIAFVIVVTCDGAAVLQRENAQLLVAEAETLVAQVNQRKNSWKAKMNARFAEMTLEEKKRLMGVRRPLPSGEKKKLTKTATDNNNDIPEQFDAREVFAECSDVISTIQDQAACGSCWAVSTSSVMSDRICIASGGKQRVNISALDLLSCEPTSWGCDGGWEDAAFRYYVKNGLCTGSNFQLQLGCKPYPWASVPHPSHEPLHKTPSCQQACHNSNYLLSYSKDKHYGQKPGMLEDGDVAKIQQEMMRAGPVTAAFMVFEDFTHYASGVYQHTSGRFLGGHAVRVIGWGVDNSTKLPYWLIANSWNTDWGDEGYFRIRRGTDECGIETWGINWADPFTDWTDRLA